MSASQPDLPFDHPLAVAFRKFHAENPHVYGLFVRFTFQAMKELSHCSADAICHRIRWYTQIETNDRAGWKINNDWAAFYARLFEAEYPEHIGFFRKRRSLADTHCLPLGESR